ncbi:MAG: InlB B-repeat-containing protein [Clostridia bacterium]|nr:InlB B-repeat-containing protein [Clostridia bacterium]
MVGQTARRILSLIIVALLATALLLPLGIASAEETVTPLDSSSDSASTPDPSTEPVIDKTKTLTVELGYDIPDGTKTTEIYVQIAQLSLADLESKGLTVQEYTYSYINSGSSGSDDTAQSAPTVTYITGKGYTLNQILSVAGVTFSYDDNISKIRLSTTAAEGAQASSWDFDLTEFSEKKRTYSNLHKALIWDGKTLSAGTAEWTEVLAMFAYSESSVTYELNADSPQSPATAETQNSNFHLLMGQNDAPETRSSSSYNGITSMRIVISTLPTFTLPTSPTADLSLEVGATHPVSIETSGGVNDALTKAYIKHLIDNGTIAFESSDPTVATVENGEIKALKAGSAVITVKYGQFSQTFEVTVTEPTPSPSPTPSPYTITYDEGDVPTGVTVSNMPHLQTKYYDVLAPIPNIEPVRSDDYVFTGWNTKKDGTGTAYAKLASYTDNASVTLYAQWKAPTIKITFVQNLPEGVTATPSNWPSEVEIDPNTSYTLPAAPTLSGYTFIYWTFVDATGATKFSTAGSEYKDGFTKDTVITAQWKAATTTEYCTVTFKANGGSMLVGSSTSGTSEYKTTVAKGSSIKLDNYVCKKNNAYPASWKGSDSKTYKTDATVTISSDITFTAQWSTTTTTTSYKVTYNGNGNNDVTNLPSTQTKSKGGSVTISSQVPVRSGYTFTGWNTAKDGKGTAYAAGTVYKTDKNLTLYAQWTVTTPTPTASPTPTPTPTPTPSPTPIPSAVLDDDVLVNPVEASLEPVVFFNDNSGETPSPTPDSEAEDDETSPPTASPTEQPKTEQEIAEEEADRAKQANTYAIVGVSNGILAVSGACLAVVKFNMQL